MKVIIAYIPVIHKGTLNFFHKYPNHLVLILGANILNRLSVGDDGVLSLRRDPRIINEKDIVQLIESVRSNGNKVRVLIEENIKVLHDVKEIVMPDEDVTRHFAKIFLSDFKDKIVFEPTFLRWDMPKSLSQISPNCDLSISFEELRDTAFGNAIEIAYCSAHKSSDWWRQVGAVMVKEREIMIFAFNHHQPTEYQPYICGDPRSNFNAGEHIELSTAGHAEATIVAEAAKRGISTKGADIIVTTFPCATCAKLIAAAGFRKLYFVEGYSQLNSIEVLKDKGVEIIHVQM